MFPEEQQNDLFQTVSQIGIGKFGRCFLCKRRTNGKLVVIKKVPQSAEAKNEARLLSLVTGHEHVVTFYESYLSYRSTYIVLEYMAGGNLDDYIQCQGEKPFKEKTVLNFTAMLASALAHIHGRRVVHRDVKPRNVLLSADHKQLKLCDLGIAVQLAEGQRLWGHIGQAGTDCYMAPELLEAQGYDFKADVWSLGCIVYELVERKRAFTGQQLAVWHKICKGRYVLSQESKFNELIASLLVPSQYNRPAAKDIPAMLDLLRARIANSSTGCVRLNFWPIRRTTTNAGADEKKKATAGEGANAGPSSTSKAATSQEEGRID